MNLHQFSTPLPVSSTFPQRESESENKKMAFASVSFLKREIEDLLNSTMNPLSSPSREILEFASTEMDFLQEISKRLIPWSRADTKFRYEVSKLKNMLKQIVEQSEKCEDQIIPKIHQELAHLKTTGENYVKELYNPLPEDDDGEKDDLSSRREEMEGLVYEFNKLKHRLRISWLKNTQITALVGMAGIGKTTLARKLLEDPNLVQHFNCRVLVKIGKEIKLKEIPQLILAELDANNGEIIQGDEDVTQKLKARLKGKRFLIVLDDVWDKYMMHHLEPSVRYERNELKKALHDDVNGSQVVFTTRLHQLDDYNVRLSNGVMNVRLLNEDESWDLLRLKVFGAEPYPYQFEKAGKKIAENCDGLPLTIVKVAKLLSEKERSLELWNEIAMQRNHPLFIAAYDWILKVLIPSYNYMSKLLQMCFLYMGVFPEGKISQSKVIDMWSTDGFLEENGYENLYPNAEKCLEELVSNNLVMVEQDRIDDSGRLGAKQIKTCRLHSSLWHLSDEVARTTKFSYVLKTRNDAYEEGIEGQFRLSFHNNVLLGIKEVCGSVEDKCAETAHSVMCYGPFQKYQVPTCFGLRLLKKLDALAIRFYEFPLEVLELVQLRYLALTLNGEIPSLVSQLSSLEFLIVDQYLSNGETLYLPREIWEMKELKQIQVDGSDLPDPCGSSSSLESLLRLLNVSARSCCNEAVMKAIPSVEKLGIRIKWDEEDDNSISPLTCFDHISYLNNLKSLKCVVMNPEVVVPSLAPMSIFPRNLIKLSLSGMGYPWKETSKISSLPCLQVLKLQNYAFQGLLWEVEEQAFSFLTILVIEDTDLEEWKIGSGSFDDLETLTMKHCYNLERIHGQFGGFLGGIKLIDCNPLGAEQMKKATQDWKVDVHFSWDEA